MQVTRARTLLDLHGSFDLEQLKRHYRQVLLRVHPDKNVNTDSHDLCTECQTAYQCLQTFLKNEKHETVLKQGQEFNTAMRTLYPKTCSRSQLVQWFWLLLDRLDHTDSLDMAGIMRDDLGDVRVDDSLRARCAELTSKEALLTEFCRTCNELHKQGDAPDELRHEMKMCEGCQRYIGYTFGLSLAFCECQPSLTDMAPTSPQDLEWLLRACILKSVQERGECGATTGHMWQKIQLYTSCNETIMKQVLDDLLMCGYLHRSDKLCQGDRLVSYYTLASSQQGDLLNWYYPPPCSQPVAHQNMTGLHAEPRQENTYASNEQRSQPTAVVQRLKVNKDPMTAEEVYTDLVNNSLLVNDLPDESCSTPLSHMFVTGKATSAKYRNRVRNALNGAVKQKTATKFKGQHHRMQYSAL